MNNINKPTFDKRKYYGNKLENGIKYALVQDKTLERSYVSIAIDIGSFDNPKEYQGLAHFLEHMLFMGSKKYPKEDHYFKKLAELGGNSNAYTDKFETVYYFNVFDHGLNEIFDIFSRFFIDPLFNENSINREVNAVNSEHRKNYNNDSWRHYQFLLNLANKDSAINTFPTGSSKTLDKKNIREELIKFYNKHYISSNISICIASALSLKDQEKIIYDTFGLIDSNKENNYNIKLNKPFFSNNLLKTYHLKSIANINDLYYIWEIPYQDTFEQTKDFEILNMIIVNASKDSLIFHLKNKGLINFLYVNIEYEGIFIIHINLTDIGFVNINYIEYVLFKTLDNIYKLNLEKYALYCKKINEINFKNLDKTEPTSLCNMLAVNHFHVNTKYIFSRLYLINKIKKTNEYARLFKKYINQNNYIRVIESQKKIRSFKYLKSQYYDLEYCIIDNVQNPLLLKNKNLLFNDFLIKDNIFLKVKGSIIENLDKNNIPTLINKNYWFGSSSEFNEPIVYAAIQITNDKYYSSPKNYLLTIISSSILNLLVKTIFFNAFDLPYNISFSCKASINAIMIHINAINDRKILELFMKDFIYFLKNLKEHMNIISDEYIDNLILSYKKNYENIDYENPWTYASYLTNINCISTEYSNKKILDELKLIILDDIRDYINTLLDESIFTTFIYGNIENNIENYNLENKNDKVYDLPKINKNKDYIITHPNKNETDNFVAYYYYIGNFSNIENVLLLYLTINKLKDEFMNNLRTKDQLGYLVSMNMYNIHYNYYIIQKIQSKKEIKFIEERMKVFNEKIEEIINNCDFDKYYDTLIKELKEKDICIHDKYIKYLSEINTRTYIFEINKLLLKYLNNMKTKIMKKDIINFIKKYVNDNNIIKNIIKGN